MKQMVRLVMLFTAIQFLIQIVVHAGLEDLVARGYGRTFVWSFKSIENPVFCAAIVSVSFAIAVGIQVFRKSFLPATVRSISLFAVISALSGTVFLFLLGPKVGFVAAIIASHVGVWLFYLIFFQPKRDDVPID